ncbi:beta strand repeat-containing protein [Rhizobium sp. PAMB 3182]
MLDRVNTETSAQNNTGSADSAAEHSNRTVRVAQNAEPTFVDPATGNAAQQPQPEQPLLPTPGQPTTVTANAENQVQLPAGVSIDNIVVKGDNLVLVQPDGSEIIIEKGSQNIPTFLIGNVEITPQTLVAALQANGINVAAGPDGTVAVANNTQSSGGDSSDVSADIGSAGPVIDLLGATELQFGAPTEDIITPPAEQQSTPNSLPTIDSIPQGKDDGAIVFEAGLPARNSEPQGSDEPSNSEKTTGAIQFTSADGVSVVSLGGHILTTADQTFSDATGDLVARYTYDPATGIGTIVYTFTLTDNTSGDDTTVSLDISVLDPQGDTATGNLVINIVDDVSTANADTDTIASGTFGPATGNVLTGVDIASGNDSNTSDGTADVQGADGATVVGVASTDTGSNRDDATSGQAATVGAAIQGDYGKLTINADGSYSYVRDAGSKGGVSDVFTYTIKDGDGDYSHTTLTVSIDDATPTINTVPAPGAAGAIVYEAALPARSGEPQGSNASATSETTSGSIAFTSKDGITAVSLGGHALTTSDQVFADGSTGTLTARYTYDANTGAGSIIYSYTLIDNTSGDSTNATFAIDIEDADGDHTAAGNLVINIVDDASTANADTDTIASGTFGPATGNVLTGVDIASGNDSNTSDGTADVQGADGATVVGVASTDTGSNLDDATSGQAATVGAAIQGLYGKLTINADGSYSYVRDAGSKGGVSDVFTYTIKDGDGDYSHTTLTVSIDDATPTINTVPAPGAAGAIVYEAALPARSGEPQGSNASATSETTSGSIAFTSKDGITAVSLGGHALTTSDQVFADGSTGTLTARYTYDANTGAGSIIYSYTLIDNTSGDSTNATFAIDIEDADGDHTAAGNLVINIVDDVSTANADTDTIASGTFGPATGNVLTGVDIASGNDSNTSDGTADVQGADGATVVGVASTDTGSNLDDATSGQAATVGAAIQGDYGKLTINADGSYSYVRDAGSKGGVSDVFTYTIKDGDGDYSHTTLTVSIDDATPTINTVPAPGAAGAIVYEAALPARSGEPQGSNASATSETTSGSIAFTSKDGITAVSLGGHALTTSDQVFADGSTGTLTARYTYDANTGAGSIIYSYTLIDNTSGDSTNATFAIDIEDADGDHTAAGNLVINIVDDASTANADTDTIASGTFGPATGNVLTGVDIASGNDSNTSDGTADVQGADGATVVGVASTDTGSNLDDATSGQAATVGAAIQGLYGKLTINADGSYSYVRDAGSKGGVSDVFTYTIKDGDGDYSHTTLTVSIDDATPTINTVPAPGAAGAIVYEAALPARSGEPQGSNASATSETTSGSIAFTSKDGITAVSLGGHALTTSDQVFADGSTGTLTARYTYDANTGAGSIIYSYTLIDNTSGDSTNATFAIDIEDADGDHTAAGNLVINIVDDVSTANADTDTIASGTFGPATGNVLTGVDIASGNDSNTSDGTADVQGADGATVVGVASTDTGSNLDDATSGQAATVGAAIQGLYGKLTINADGSYSYVRDAGSKGGVSDVFTYTIKDGDGDYSHTTLTVSIDDATPTINTVPAPGAAGAIVYEAALPARSGEPQGSNASATSETTSGSIAFTSKDGITAVSLGGHALTTSDQVFADGSTGTLTARYTYDANTGAGSIIYSYTLIDNTSGDSTNATFAIDIEDADGDHTAAGNLVINIVDDVSTANADTDTIASGTFGPATGNVLTGVDIASGNDSNTSDGTADVQGADGATVVGVASTDTGSNLDDATSGQAATVGAAIQGDYGKLTINADGSYSYVRDAGSKGGVSDVFTYTIKDGDGDYSHTTLTVSIDDATPTINTVPAPGAEGAIVYEAALPARSGEPQGSNASATSETTSGSVAFTSKDGITAVSLGGHALTTSDQVFADGSTGTLTARYTYDANTGAGSIIYSYTLIDNTSGDSTNATFAIDIEDADGDHTAAGNLVINIVDDASTANADTDTIASGTFGPATGNVLTGVDIASGNDSNTSDGTADVQGADGATVVGVASTDTGSNRDDATSGQAATVGAAIQGDYGKLTINADGSYSYVRDAGSKGGVSDVFTYTIKDGDGDYSHTTLTVSIDDATPTINTVPAPGAAGAIVYEAALPARSGEPQGSNASATSETTSGSIAFTSKDGITAVSLGGHALTTSDQVFADGSTGTLTARYTYDANTGAGSIIYSYTLIDNTSGDSTNATFAIDIEDADGDHTAAGNLVINIVDDVPTAVIDSGSVNEGASLTVNAASGVLANDIAGADGAVVAGVRAAGADTTSAVTSGINTVINGLYGTLTLQADGSYVYHSTANAISGAQQDVFVYTVVDGDGDLSTTTLTINLADANLAAPADSDVTVYEAALDTSKDGADLAAGTVTGSIPAGTGETDASNQLNATGGFGTLTYALVGSPTGSYGTIQINSDGSYVYTLTKPFDTTPDANNANNTETAESFTYSVTDANGNTTTGTITVNIVDDVPTLGAFMSAVIPNQTGTANGFFDVNFGADGYNHGNTFDIHYTGPTLNGVTFTETDLGGGVTEFLAETSTGTDIFKLTVSADGTYTFNLITPEASQDRTVTVSDLAPGNTHFRETSDGRIELTAGPSAGATVNASGPGFGVNNQFLGDGETLNMEFHHTGNFGTNDSPTSDPEYLSSLTLTVGQLNGSAVTINWTATNSLTGQTESGSFSVGAAGTYTIDPSILSSFNVIQLSASGGSGNGIRIDTITEHITILPQDQNLTFDIVARDGDGDLSSTSSIAVHQVAATSTSYMLNGGADEDVIATSNLADTITGGSGYDIVDYRDDTTGVTVNLLTGHGSGGTAAGDIYSGIEGILGGLGDDTLVGDSGDNLLDGGSGSDHMTGDTGDDTFVISADTLAIGIDDIITDYHANEDTVDLTSLLNGLAGVTDPHASGYVQVVQSGSDALVQVDTNGNGDNYQTVAILNGFNSALNTVHILYDDATSTPHQANV